LAKVKTLNRREDQEFSGRKKGHLPVNAIWRMRLGMVGKPAWYELSELPLWRKVLIGLVVGFSALIGYSDFSTEADIYVSAPRAPVVATGQVSPVHVNHGYLRYVSPDAAANLAFLRVAGPTVGALALVAVGILLLTYQGARRK
jgi:hypothetical protein